jgi:hypothetical protein
MIERLKKLLIFPALRRDGTIRAVKNGRRF